MLLRRLTGHVRDQNWFAVGIDFVVVVVGIFVGLQVDEWNQQRENRGRERLHLEQIYAEAQLNADRIGQLAEFHAEIVDNLTFAIGVIKRGALAADDEDRFKWTILTLAQVAPLGLSLGSYDALIASGDFSLLRDQWVKDWLVRTASFLDAEQDFVVYVRENIGLPEALEAAVVSAVPHPSGRGVEWRVDFEILKDHPRTLAILAGNKFVHERFRDTRRDLADRIVEGHAYIGRLLGKEQTPSPE